jgi:hypothetical protein
MLREEPIEKLRVGGRGRTGSPAAQAPGFRVAPTPATLLISGFRRGVKLSD